MDRPEELVEEYVTGWDGAARPGPAVALAILVCSAFSGLYGVPLPWDPSTAPRPPRGGTSTDRILRWGPEQWAWALSAAVPGRGTGGRGSVGTPPSLARLMCRLAVREMYADPGVPTVDSVRVIDPAVGGGVFLIAAASELLAVDVAAGGGLRCQVNRRVYGVDVDPSYVLVARAVSWLWELESFVGQRCPAPAGARVFLADSLLASDQWWASGPGEPGSFDLFVANPPYIRQELVSAGEKAALAEKYPGFGGRSDVYARFFVLAARLLKPGGVGVIVTPSSWMDVSYGLRVKQFLLDNFEIVSITGSSEARLFDRASVNAQITLFRKHRRRDARRAGTRFVNVGVAWSTDDPGAGCTTSTVHLQALDPSRKWGIYLRAPSAYYGFADRALSGSVVGFCRLGELAEVRFGTKTGANGFFYLRDVTGTPAGNLVLRRHGNPDGANAVRPAGAPPDSEPVLIESCFLRPVVKSLREVKGYRLDVNDLKTRVFDVCSRGPGPDSPFASEYLRRGEEAGYPSRPSCRGRSPWYRLPFQEADLLYAMSWGSRMGVVLHDRTCRYDARFYGIRANEGIDALVLAAALNATCTWLFTELSGRAMTGNLPLLDIKVYEVELLPVLDVRLLDAAQRNELKARMVALLSRDMLDIATETALPDRRSLDLTVLMMAGFERGPAEELATDIAANVRKMVTDRIGKSRKVLCVGPPASYG
ncbi:MAG: N-6 DNA methylase [Firmicutes bacterium]|nr:N-6 DNA methylase [Bacillota bacterium]